ncbi:MAG: purine-nucleoside phosphorylase [Bacilli bacterium]|nr:purine-nucleoside phosphorylase [Bacilli bacterium]
MTAHNEAEKKDIAKKVIMPGDPLRAKFIAENYLENFKLVNKVRNMLAYTGTYKGIEVTIMGSGMGMPSIGIYSYELFNDYNVDTIIRIGTCGSYHKDLDVFDMILVKNSISDSSYAKVQNGYDKNYIESSKMINENIKKIANQNDFKITEGDIYSSDVFYKDINSEIEKKCLGVEMESFALFHNANILNKKAACILTVSNSFVTNKETTSEQREKSFTKMIELALDSIIESE